MLPLLYQRTLDLSGFLRLNSALLSSGEKFVDLGYFDNIALISDEGYQKSLSSVYNLSTVPLTIEEETLEIVEQYRSLSSRISSDDSVTNKASAPIKTPKSVFINLSHSLRQKDTSWCLKGRLRQALLCAAARPGHFE
ncbi:hypothetical protein CLF_110011 [Clonorchis sinensis]|uniref:Uncharacterized protein n=1 Tax=Clonorchis sinensis TaxID=79923 RepID=G7YK45_CLOSI|nr:hypothetical protein CLF_110011 [Clonorchis sinensis]